jgi:type IV pilus assembly protein PilN
MRVTLNLATRPFADLGPSIKRLRIGMGALALVSIALAIGLHAIHQKAEVARARDHSLDGQIAAVTHEREGYESMMRQPDNAKLLEQAATLNQLIDDKGFSWTLAMEDLETVLPARIQATALEPQRSKDGRTTTLHLRVVGPRDLSVDLVRNLEHSRRFVAPRIVGETAEANERPGQQLTPVSASDRVDFELLADYTPVDPGDLKAAHKASAKSAEAAGESPAVQRHAARPAPLAPVVPGRVPYPVAAQPTNNPVPNDGPQRPRRAPFAPQPMTLPQPQAQPGGPQ